MSIFPVKYAWVEETWDSRFREVEHLLGISAHNSVSDWVIFPVCGLEVEEKEILENNSWGSDDKPPWWWWSMTNLQKSISPADWAGSLRSSWPRWPPGCRWGGGIAAGSGCWVAKPRCRRWWWSSWQVRRMEISFLTASFPETTFCEQTVESKRVAAFPHFHPLSKNEPAGFQVFTGCDDYLLLHCVRHLSLTSCHERIKNEILKANNQHY